MSKSSRILSFLLLWSNALVLIIQVLGALEVKHTTRLLDCIKVAIYKNGVICHFKPLKCLIFFKLFI